MKKNHILAVIHSAYLSATLFGFSIYFYLYLKGEPILFRYGLVAVLFYHSERNFIQLAQSVLQGVKKKESVGKILLDKSLRTRSENAAIWNNHFLHGNREGGKGLGIAAGTLLPPNKKVFLGVLLIIAGLVLFWRRIHLSVEKFWEPILFAYGIHYVLDGLKTKGQE